MHCFSCTRQPCCTNRQQQVFSAFFIKKLHNIGVIKLLVRETLSFRKNSISTNLVIEWLFRCYHLQIGQITVIQKQSNKIFPDKVPKKNVVTKKHLIISSRELANGNFNGVFRDVGTSNSRQQHSRGLKALLFGICVPQMEQGNFCVPSQLQRSHFPFYFPILI